MAIGPIVTLTTDFGAGSTYPAQMKGVILSIAPHARVIDITHDVPPQDVLEGALALEAAVPAFPAGTIHVAIVDPGVGSRRLAVAVLTDLGVFVGPDNGLFELVLRMTEVRQTVALDRPAYHRVQVAPTFHGRDIFAPVAAHLANGAGLDMVGSTIGTLKRLSVPEARKVGDEVHGEVLTADRFGNLITSIRAADLAERDMRSSVVVIGGVATAFMGRTYADVSVGELVAYLGSSGRLEVGLREGNALQQLGAGRGTDVIVKPG